jgi:hypothetical protein
MKRILGMAVLASSFVAAGASAEGPPSMKPSTGKVAGGPIAGGPIVGAPLDGPSNDDCLSVIPTVLLDGISVTFTGDNTGATNQCPGYDSDTGNEGHVWEAFIIGPECWAITLDYCGTAGPFGNAWVFLNGPILAGEDCSECKVNGNSSFDTTTCGDGNVTINWVELRPGTYYYPVMNDALNNSVGPYTINVLGTDLGFCNILPPVPTVSEWGLIVMGLLLLIAGTIVIRRRHAVAEAA